MTQILTLELAIGRQFTVAGPGIHVTVAQVVPGLGIEATITRTAAAAIGPYTAGDLPTDAYTPGTYVSTLGAIVALNPVFSVNGAPWNGSSPLAGMDVVTLVETPTDDADPANSRPFAYGPALVPAVAPEVTVALAEAVYVAGDVLTLADIDTVIVTAGSPALGLGEISIGLLVDESPVALPHTAEAGQQLVPVAAWDHPAGDDIAFGAPVIVDPLGEIITYAPTFTAVVAQTIFAGQAPSAAFPVGVEATANYQSSAGAIASATRQVSIDGAWTATLTGARDPGDTVAIRVRVVDSAANERFVPGEAGSAVTVQAMSVPVVNAIPSIAGQGFSGQTQTATEATWQAIPGTPPGMARTIEVRWTRNGADVGTATTIVPTNAQIGEVLRREARARHSLAGKVSAWSDWSQSAAVTIQALPVPVNSSAPSINNAPARIAKEMTQAGAVWAAPPAQPASMTQEYEAEWLVDGTFVSSAPTYTPGEGGNSLPLTRRARSRFTLGGQNGAWSAWAVSDPLTITYNPPSASGTVPDQAFTPGGAITPLDLKAFFTVSGDADLSGCTFALALGSDALPTGLSLSSAGVLSGTPTVEVVRDIIVRATNSGGTADQPFEIEVAAVVIPATNYARSYTENIGSIVIDLSAIGPAESGAATYATIGSLPSGVTRSGDELTVNTATAVSGTATVRRTDGNGDRDLVLTLTMVEGALTAEGGDNYAFTGGDDDPGATEYTIFATGGPLDDTPITFTRSALNALAEDAALLVTDPIIDFDTDADSDGELDEDDVLELVQAAVRVHRDGETPPASSYQWRDTAGAISGATSTTYTGAGDEDTEVFLRETVGGASRDSDPVPVDDTPAATAPAAFTVGQWTLAAANMSISALPDDGGSTITALQYRIGTGSATSLGGTTTGTYAHAGVEDDDIQIRAVNAIGAGDWSDVKAVPAAAAGITSTFLGTRIRGGTGAYADFTNPAPAAGQRLVVFVNGEPYGSGPFGITVNGGSTLTPLESVNNASENSMSVFELAAPAGATITIASVFGGGAGINACAAYIIENGARRDSALIRGASPQTATVDVAAGGLVLAGVSATWYAANDLEFSAGATSDGLAVETGGSTEVLRVGSATGLSADATYDVTGTNTAGNPAVAAVSMEPV